MYKLCCTLATALLIVACADAHVLGPALPAGCESPRACQVAGADLVVDSPVLLLPANQTIHAATGLPVLAPNQRFRAVVKVWNRGDKTSLARSMYLHDGDSIRIIEVPALVPGQLLTDTFDVGAPKYKVATQDQTEVYVNLKNLSEDDAFPQNDVGSAPYIYAVPVIQATQVFPDTIRMGEPFTGSVTFRNTSLYADLEPHTVTFCLAGSFSVPCSEEGVGPLQLTSIPRIKAGESVTMQFTLSTGTELPCRFCFLPFSWWIVPCLAAGNASPEAFVAFSGEGVCVGESRRIVVHAPAALR